MNKKGAEMTIGTIVFIILALVVLVVLIYGFTVGWGDLWEQISGIGGGKVNVQTVVKSCELACSTGSYYDFCQRGRDIIFAETETKQEINCHELLSRNVGLSCESLTCKSCIDFAGSWSEENVDCEEGYEDKTADSADRFRESNKNKKCCVAEELGTS